MTQCENRQARIDRWIATLEIREALAEYFRGLTRGDAERARRIFHADATENHGPVSGRAHELIDQFIAHSGSAYECAIRHVLDAWVEIRGNRARSEAGWINILRDVRQDMVYAGRYLDLWENREGVWKVARRLAVVDWWRYAPRGEEPFFDGAEAILDHAGRGFQDPEVRRILGLDLLEAGA